MSNIESTLKEERRFEPSADFAAKAHIGSLAEYEKLYERAKADPDGFWSEIAEELHWFEKWTKVLDWNPPDAKWFVGARTNVAYNCVDRHTKGPRKNKAAIIWEGEPGDSRVLTYHDLYREVSQAANMLKQLGVEKGDRVAIYMPMVPELAITMLACARIGAVHTVVFGGFAAEALADRINDCQAKVVVTADGGFRRGAVVPLKKNVDAALEKAPGVRAVVVYRRTGEEIRMQPGRDHWWHQLMSIASASCRPEPLDSEHPLYILYTSGTTGKPKGIVHTTGGYMVGTYITSKWVFDLKEDDTYWCTADAGWVTGHSYVVYGILANGATTVMYEGAPNHPQPDRFWEIVDKYAVTIFYTAPTAIRAFMKWGEQYPMKHDLSSLRLLGSVGEPINPEAWMWYREIIGKGKCPIVDTWWQTETGSIMVSPLPGATPTPPGSATRPLPGILPDVVDAAGKPVPANHGGNLVMRRPWPAMARTIHNDHERYTKVYWSIFPGNYLTGDGARIDDEGNVWLMGRTDDVINVAGHRLGTMEIESSLVSHPKVAEAAVVGRPDAMKGQGIVAFVTLGAEHRPSPALKEELRQHVATQIGALARPDEIRFADMLPKTRSGKIMRRLLKEIASGNSATGDTTTLEDLSVLASLRAGDDE